MVILKNWSVGDHPEDAFIAPERRSLHLRGEVYGHPRFPDGSKVTTSKIVASDGRVVKTYSREYLLEGPPEQGYADYLKSINYPLDEANPVKVHTINAGAPKGVN